MTTRLFLPVNDIAFNAWQSGDKLWEIRPRSGEFSKQRIVVGRPVAIRASIDATLYGLITEVHTAQTVEAIFRVQSWSRVIPWADSWGHACEIAYRSLGPTKGVGLIVFRVELEGGDECG